jgi:hypothetical protein
MKIVVVKANPEKFGLKEQFKSVQAYDGGPKVTFQRGSLGKVSREVLEATDWLDEVTEADAMVIEPGEKPEVELEKLKAVHQNYKQGVVLALETIEPMVKKTDLDQFTQIKNHLTGVADDSDGNDNEGPTGDE